MPYLAEYTDTFGGEANYSWVRRAAFTLDFPAGAPRAARNRALLSAARKALNLQPGVRGDVTADYGDELHWVPRGCCTILMVRWDDSPATVRLLSGEESDA